MLLSYSHALKSSRGNRSNYSEGHDEVVSSWRNSELPYLTVTFTTRSATVPSENQALTVISWVPAVAVT